MLAIVTGKQPTEEHWYNKQNEYLVKKKQTKWIASSDPFTCHTLSLATKISTTKTDCLPLNIYSKTHLSISTAQKKHLKIHGGASPLLSISTISLARFGVRSSCKRWEAQKKQLGVTPQFLYHVMYVFMHRVLCKEVAFKASLPANE